VIAPAPAIGSGSARSRRLWTSLAGIVRGNGARRHSGASTTSHVEDSTAGLEPYRSARSMPGDNSSTPPNHRPPPVELEPAAQAFADAAAEPPYLFQLDPFEGRARVAQAQDGRAGKPDAEIEDTSIQGGLVGEISIRIVRPKGVGDPLPAVIYLHGGGWVFGDQDTYDGVIRELAPRTEAAVVFPNYSRAPEERYPTAIEESYAVLRHVADRGSERNLDGSRIAVVGDSTGANMAAALTLLAKQRSAPPIAAQVLFYPVTDAACDTASYVQFAEGYHLRRDAMQWFWDQYIPDCARRDEITASPLRADSEQLAGLPPALIITAEADVLRDEGEAYARKLRAAAVAVIAVRYQATIHDFVVLDALRNTNAARGAIAQAVDYLRHALAVGPPYGPPTGLDSGRAKPRRRRQ
jgi:acetyl esterase